MENFELTKELLAKAKTYMPLAEKTIYAELIARKSLKAIKPLQDKEDIKTFLLVPSVVGEDLNIKEQCLLNVLLSHYFNIKLPQMNNKIYDKYMGSHILNQLERYKSDPEYKTKAFDILTDFKLIKKMVDAEIYNFKTKENDFLERFMKGLSLFSLDKMTNDPEYLKKMQEELKKFVTAAQAHEQATIAKNATVEEGTKGE